MRDLVRALRTSGVIQAISDTSKANHPLSHPLGLNLCIKKTIFMTTEEAKLALSYHSGRNDDVGNDKWTFGFLGSLRPYTGTLIEENFHEVIECLRILEPELQATDKIDRQIAADITAIAHLGRAWGAAEDGMLRRNNLIAESDWKRLERWTEIIACTFIFLLDGRDPEVSFEAYRNYLSQNS